MVLSTLLDKPQTFGLRRASFHPWSKLRDQSCLLTYLIRGDAVQPMMALQRNDLQSITVNRVVASFAHETKAVVFQVSCHFPPIDRHLSYTSVEMDSNKTPP